MWGVRLASKPFVRSLFEVQIQGEEPEDQQSVFVDQFDRLIQDHSASLDRPMQDGGADPSPERTHVWLACWESRQAYQTWWTSPDASNLWASLPQKAGMWREIISPQSSHAQHGTNGRLASIGLGPLRSRISIDHKFGYWGCYCHPKSAPSSERGPMETLLDRPLSRSLVISGSENIDYLISDDPQNTQPPREYSIRHGRVRMSHFPNNICFLVEGQDHAQLSPEGHTYWFEHFEPSVT